MSTKRKADCTPEEWEKILEYKRNWRATHKHKTKKEDYTEEEWNRKLEYNRKRYKEREDVRIKNKERYKKWREDNPERAKQYYKNYRDKNREEINARQKDRYKNDNNLREKNKKQCANYHKKNKQKVAQRKKEYRLKHIEEYKEKAKTNGRCNKLLFSRWAHKLSIDEDPIQDKDGYILVRDYHTKEYFYPTRNQLTWRVCCLQGKSRGEMHLYKNEESKRNCPVYNQEKYFRTDKKRKDGYIDAYWRNQVILRASGHCERCGKESDKLVAHHVAPRATCAFDGDIDNGMALCPECHKEVHSTDGCRLHELATEKREAV